VIALELSGYTLVDPWFLLGIPVVLGLLVLRLLRPRAALPAASLLPFAALPRTLRQRCAHAPSYALALAAVSLCVALARPVIREVVPLQEQGVEIAMLVDISSSMLTRDMDDAGKLRRVDAARQRALEFAAARKGDRVGMITFSRFAELRCPLTLDGAALASFLRTIEAVTPGSQLDGTAIGTGLAKGVQILGKGKAKSKVIVILSDGENNIPGPDGQGGIAPEDAAAMAADARIRVHTIGLGTGDPDPFGGRMHELAFTALRQIAEKTGGRFFKARSDQDLKEVYAEIDRLERTPMEEPRYRMNDAFEPPLLLGLLLLGVALLLDLLWIRAVP